MYLVGMSDGTKTMEQASRSQIELQLASAGLMIIYSLDFGVDDQSDEITCNCEQKSFL